MAFFKLNAWILFFVATIFIGYVSTEGNATDLNGNLKSTLKADLGSTTSSPVASLTHASTTLEVSPKNTTKTMDKSTTTVTELSSKKNESLISDAEILQPSDETHREIDEPEERFNRPSINFITNSFSAEDIEVNTGKLKDGHIMAIFAGFLAVLCIGIYMTLILWRSYLEKRYGMRERLVTEDDYYNNNDIRQFTL